MHVSAAGLRVSHDVGPSQEEPTLSLHTQQVAKGLSQLGRSASGAHQVYQRLQITHTNLDNPQHIAHCQHIQQLLLANNCLTTLQPLAQLQHLTSLDASNNRLTKVGFLALNQMLIAV